MADGERRMPAKEPGIWVKLEAAEKEALIREAEIDQRSMSAFARKLIVAYLREKGVLEPPKPARTAAKPARRTKR
jgi:hypothetical protein